MFLNSEQPFQLKHLLILIFFFKVLFVEFPGETQCKKINISTPSCARRCIARECPKVDLTAECLTGFNKKLQIARKTLFAFCNYQYF